MSIFSPAERDAALARAIELLKDDRRVEAAVITGSIGAGRADRWSDFDLTAIVVEGESCERLASEWEVLAYQEWPVAHHYATAFGSTLVRGFILANGLLADLAFTPIADFEAWAPVRVAFDRTGATSRVAEAWRPWSPTPDWHAAAGFAAHDVLHACVAANRGRSWQSLFYLQRIRNRTLALASERHGDDAEEFTHVDELPAEEVQPLSKTLVADLERNTLLTAIDLATRAFLDELRRGSPDLADRLSDPLLTVVRASQADRPVR